MWHSKVTGVLLTVAGTILGLKVLQYITPQFTSLLGF